MATLKWTYIQLAQELLNDDENDDDDNAIATAMKYSVEKLNNNNVIYKK